MNPAGRRSRNPALLHIRHKFLIQAVQGGFVQFVRLNPKTHNVQPDRGQKLQFRFPGHSSCEILSLFAVLLDQLPEFANAVFLDREPDLQRAKTPR
jgi:hypothetical protein